MLVRGSMRAVENRILKWLIPYMGMRMGCGFADSAMRASPSRIPNHSRHAVVACLTAAGMDSFGAPPKTNCSLSTENHSVMTRILSHTCSPEVSAKALAWIVVGRRIARISGATAADRGIQSRDEQFETAREEAARLARRLRSKPCYGKMCNVLL